MNVVGKVLPVHSTQTSLAPLIEQMLHFVMHI